MIAADELIRERWPAPRLSRRQLAHGVGRQAKLGDDQKCL
jgi:hypothetical protein